MLLLLTFSTQLLAQQEVEFPDYAPEERWDRVSRLAIVSMTATIRHAKDLGQDVDEFGAWWADLFDDSWGEPESYGPRRVIRGMRRNWLSFHGGEVEVVEVSTDEATARFNEYYAEAFGDDGMLYGVSLDEYERVTSLFFRGLADYHGLDYEERRDGGDWIVTYRRR